MSDETKPNGFPCYQWSYFPDDTKQSQFVVRANNSVEFENKITKLIPLIKKVEAQLVPPATTQAVATDIPVVVTPSVQPANTLTATCEVHKDAQDQPVKMSSKISKRTGNEYWSHSRKLPNGKWDICFGKGWESEKKQ